MTLEDYEAAAVDLQNRLAGALAAHLRDPQQATQGLTVYRETAEPGEASIEPASGQVVGSKAADFRLSGAIEASVLAVDEQLVRDLAAAAVEAEVPPGMTLLPGDPAIEASEGLAEGDRIVFESSAQGTAYQIIDRDELLSRLAGKPVSEARAILEVVGTATVSVWPDFLADLPGDPDRIRLDIQEPATAE